MGLGDKGIQGIKEFCQQHECNRICKALGLPSLADLYEEIILSDDPYAGK